MKFAPILFLLVALGLTPACSTMTVDSAQGALEPYSFAIDGAADGLVAFNARFVAVDAQVKLVITFRNRDTVLWQQTFEQGAGKRAYRIVFDGEDNFVQMEPVAWDVAAASLTWLEPVTAPQP